MGHPITKPLNYMSGSEKNLDEILTEQVSSLPKVVQDAILSASVEKRLRDLASTHKLHLDQWQKLENEVMLTLIGMQATEELAKNIEKEVGVAPQVALDLANAIGETIFQPIRQELERELEHPEAKEKKVSDVEQVRAEALEASSVVAPVMSASKPEMPKAMRTPLSETYKSKVLSTERKASEGDPYREPAQ